MGLHAHRKHWLKAETPGPNGTTIRHYQCGEEDSYKSNHTLDAAKVDCRGCAAYIAKTILAARPTTEPKLELVSVKIKGERSTYEIHVDGEHRGWVCYEGAYKNAEWYVREIGIRETGETYLGPQLDDRKYNYRHDRGFGYPTKDHALLSVPYWRSRGELPTLAEKKAAQTAWDARLAAGEKRRAAEALADKTLLSETLEALSDIIETVTLTNFQRAGVQDAIRRLTPEPE